MIVAASESPYGLPGDLDYAPSFEGSLLRSLDALLGDNIGDTHPAQTNPDVMGFSNQFHQALVSEAWAKRECPHLLRGARVGGVGARVWVICSLLARGFLAFIWTLLSAKVSEEEWLKETSIASRTGWVRVLNKKELYPAGL